MDLGLSIELTLIRHGEAQVPSGGRSDFDRPLTERGIVQARWTGKVGLGASPEKSPEKADLGGVRINLGGVGRGTTSLGGSSSKKNTVPDLDSKEGVQLFLVSSARRAKETAKYILESLGGEELGSHPFFLPTDKIGTDDHIYEHPRSLVGSRWESHRSIYEADAQDLLEFIADAAELDSQFGPLTSIAVVGHNPTLSQVASLLSGSTRINMGTADLVRLRYSVRDHSPEVPAAEMRQIWRKALFEGGQWEMVVHMKNEC